MRSVAGEIQSAVLHGVHDEASHRRDALLEYPSLVQAPAISCRQPHFQFLPHALVWPRVELVIRMTLHVEPRYLWRTHAVQREAALVPRVDYLVQGRWHGG